MAKQKVYREPFSIQKGYNFEVHHVSYQSNLGYSCFMHFHEVHEIIVFEKIDGVYFYSQGKSELQDHDIVFTPSMETHDFELEDKAKSWFIIQFLPEFLVSQKLHNAATFFQQGMHLRMSVEHFEALKTQVTWLFEAYQQNPQSDLPIIFPAIFNTFFKSKRRHTFLYEIGIGNNRTAHLTGHPFGDTDSSPIQSFKH